MNKRKTMNHKKKEMAAMKKRFLVSVNVLGSAGAIRFVVDEDDEVSGVIDTALKAYAREGRFPVIGSDANNFLLYCTNVGSDALSPSQKIGSTKGRDFLLCKKDPPRREEEEGDGQQIKARRGCGWKAWLLKSFSFKMLKLQHATSVYSDAR